MLLVTCADTLAMATTLISGASGYARWAPRAGLTAAVRDDLVRPFTFSPVTVQLAYDWLCQQFLAQDRHQPEAGVLQLMLAGYNDPHIMAKLRISKRGLDAHIAGILSALYQLDAVNDRSANQSSPGEE
jgi:hypothetical protein